MEKHKLKDVDKNGFPTNDKGQQVPIFDGNGNAVLLLNSNLIERFPKGAAIVFDPKNKLEVRKGLDNLIGVLTNKFDDHIKDNFTIDLTEEAKSKHRVYTKEPLVVPIVQMYFSWINGWLNYLGNCYNIEFKLLFYSKYKEKIKNNLIALETGLNNHEIDKNHLKFVEKWLKETDKNIEIERKAKKKNKIKKAIISNNSFSVLEWAAAFYYANDSELISTNSFIKDRMIEFMKNHSIGTTFKNFKAKYYEARNRITKKNDFPIFKLKLIIPFMNENYKKSVSRIESDMKILTEELPDY